MHKKKPLESHDAYGAKYQKNSLKELERVASEEPDRSVGRDGANDNINCCKLSTTIGF